MRKLRPMLLPALLVLAACGGDGPAKLPALPGVDTFRVAPATAESGRGWDGVVEAVRRSDLAAQTAGRVTTVVVDVNDRVKQGDVLLRITAVEQDAGASAARAQLRASEASATSAPALEPRPRGGLSLRLAEPFSSTTQKPEQGKDRATQYRFTCSKR